MYSPKIIYFNPVHVLEPKMKLQNEPYLTFHHEVGWRKVWVCSKMYTENIKAHDDIRSYDIPCCDRHHNPTCKTK